MARRRASVGASGRRLSVADLPDWVVAFRRLDLARWLEEGEHAHGLGEFLASRRWRAARQEWLELHAPHLVHLAWEDWRAEEDRRWPWPGPTLVPGPPLRLPPCEACRAAPAGGV